MIHVTTGLDLRTTGKNKKSLVKPFTFESALKSSWRRDKNRIGYSMLLTTRQELIIRVFIFFLFFFLFLVGRLIFDFFIWFVLIWFDSVKWDYLCQLPLQSFDLCLKNSFFNGIIWSRQQWILAMHNVIRPISVDQASIFFQQTLTFLLTRDRENKKTNILNYCNVEYV